MKSRWAALSLCALLATFPIPAGAEEPGPRPEVPVVIGGDMMWDACASQGVVAGLDPAGDGFLAVKSGPGLKYKRLGKIYNGQVVNMCGQRGDWVAIVYTTSHQNCNVATPWPRKLPYTGPCRSGWAHQNWISLFAG